SENDVVACIPPLLELCSEKTWTRRALWLACSGPDLFAEINLGNFAVTVLGHLRPKQIPLGFLERGDFRLAPFVELGSVDRLTVAAHNHRNHLFAPLFVGSPDHRDLEHLGVTSQHLFDLTGVNVG